MSYAARPPTENRPEEYFVRPEGYVAHPSGDTPPPVPNPLLRASCRLLLETDSGLTPPTGPDISDWASQVAFGDASQPTSGNQPAYDANVFKGGTVPGVTFTGANVDHFLLDALAAEFTGEDVPMTVLVALRTPASFATQVLFSLGHSVTTPRMTFGITTTGRLQVLRRDDAAASVTATGTASELAVSTNYVIAFVFTGNEVTAYINKVASVALNAFAMDVGALTLTRAAVGALRSSTTTAGYNASIGAVAVYAEAIAVVDREPLDDYLIGKYN